MRLTWRLVPLALIIKSRLPGRLVPEHRLYESAGFLGAKNGMGADAGFYHHRVVAALLQRVADVEDVGDGNAGQLGQPVDAVSLGDAFGGDVYRADAAG